MSSLSQDACLTIDRESGEIAACNAAAQILLACDGGQLCGRSWFRLLHGGAATREALQRALGSRRRMQLPAVILCRDDGREILAGAMVVPLPEGHGDYCELLLWPLDTDVLARLAPPPGTGDVIAAIGVACSPDAEPPAPEGERLLRQLCATTAQVLPVGDTVAIATDSTLVAVLRGVELAAASNICRAALSHLHRSHGEALSGLRLCVGLAEVGAQRSVPASLLAASHALLQSMSSGAAQQIRLAHDSDHAALVRAAMVADGVFGGPPGRVQAEPERPAAGVKELAPPPPVRPLERDIEGYVADNMEGAVDQALFLAGLDVPVGIVGPAGTGKMYIARIIHEQAGGTEETLVQVDCREFRGRSEANRRISRELAASAGRTLVFKSPHLMPADAQLRLARQIGSRTLTDVSPPRALPAVRFIALFPDGLEQLLRQGQLCEPLAGVFAGFPIVVPPIRDRKQAVLRWAHKILGQEGARRDRDMKGFTPDAERALLSCDWPGNISQMRRCISEAMERTDRDWLTPVDLGLYQGIEPDGSAAPAESQSFLAGVLQHSEPEENYAPSSFEALDAALAAAVHDMLELGIIRPLGTWLEDDVVVAALQRYRGDVRRAAAFLHTRPRNISRWQPKIAAREEERSASALWQLPRRLLQEWLRESPQLALSPLQSLADRLLEHVERQASGLTVARRARILGVSTPTYGKRLRAAGGDTAESVSRGRE